jgi:hypothetical protein
VVLARAVLSRRYDLLFSQGTKTHRFDLGEFLAAAAAADKGLDASPEILGAAVDLTCVVEFRFPTLQLNTDL